MGNRQAVQPVILPIPYLFFGDPSSFLPKESALISKDPQVTTTSHLCKEAVLVDAQPDIIAEARDVTEAKKGGPQRSPVVLVRTHAEIQTRPSTSLVRVSAVLDPQSPLNWISEQRLESLKALLPRHPTPEVQYHQYEDRSLQGNTTVKLVWRGTRPITFSDIFYIACGTDVPMELVFGRSCLSKEFGDTNAGDAKASEKSINRPSRLFKSSFDISISDSRILRRLPQSSTLTASKSSSEVA